MDKSVGIGGAIALAAVFAVSSCSVSCYNMAQHDRKVLSNFRGQILKGPKAGDMVSVKADGVTREGPLAIGSAIANGTGDHKTAFILAGDPQSKCYYATLRVVDGSQNLPFLEKLGGGELPETWFVNPTFSSGYDCAPLPSGNGTVLGQSANPAPTQVPSLSLPQPGK